MDNATVALVHNAGLCWFKHAEAEVTVWVKGFAFEGSAVLSEARLARACVVGAGSGERRSVADQVRWLLERGNGCYAVVVETGEAVFAAVDRMRSLPLFYGQRGEEFFLSDDANWVRRQVHDDRMDETARTEFLLTGYVTGRETLFANVKQLMAGEWLVAEKGAGVVNVKTARYYRFVHGDFFDLPEEALYPLMTRMFESVFGRLLEETRGRTLVVPLSGGYDSRLIVAMLKRLGRSNVMCYSYGVPGNWEPATSREVASRLGYPWLFVPYSRELWRRSYASAEARRYYGYANGLCSLPHVQDWPAVWELKKRGAIPDDALIIPGHSAFVAGQNTPPHLATLSRVDLEAVVRSIWKKHYSLWDWSKREGVLGPIMKERVCRVLGDLSTESPEEAANACEYWDWQERQAKFIVNSVRAYEDWGYGWRIPLLDNEVMAFFSKVPLNFRLGKGMYVRYLANVLCRELGVSHHEVSRLSAWRRFRKRAGALLPLPVREGARRYASLYSKLRNPWFALGGFSDYAAVLRLYTRRFGWTWKVPWVININTLVTYTALRDIEARISRGRPQRGGARTAV